MNSPATDVADHIAALGLGSLAGTSSWGIYIADSPSEPDECITVYDTGGVKNEPNQELYENLIQVSVRSSSWGLAYDKITAIRDSLILPKSVTLGDWLYVGFWLMSDVATIGKDQKNRYQLVCNIRLLREPII